MYGYEIFHEKQMYSLIKTIQQKQNNHAYIFHGEPGIGRHIAAQMIACALVCENTKQAPCGSCSACVQAKAGTNPDIFYLTAPKDKKSIGVDEIRELSEDCYIRPFLTKDKVYIIDGDYLTEAAQNAFLKTLEEPPHYAVFIIISSDISKLLPTINSRCSKVYFNSLSADVIKSYITKNFPNEERIDFLINYSGGNPGKICEIVNNQEFEKLRLDSLEKLPSLLSDRLLACFSIADYLDEHKENIAQIFDFWLLYLRDVILISEGMGDKIANTDQGKKLSVLASRFEPSKIAYAMQRIALAQEMSTRFVNQRAISFNLCLSIKNPTK